MHVNQVQEEISRKIKNGLPRRDLGGYDVEGVLGEGGFSHVVLATDKASGQRVALKLHHASGATLDAPSPDSSAAGGPPRAGEDSRHSVGAGQALLEAAVHTSLAHEPSIHPCTAAFVATIRRDGRLPSADSGCGAKGGRGDDCTLALVGLEMELAAGDMATWLRGRGKAAGGLEDAPLCRRIIQMANALRVVHAAGYAHGDVKLDNWLLSPQDGAPRLSDFGLVRALGDADGVMGGAPWAQSPQRLRGEDDGVAGDWWALGVAAYQLAAGDTHAWPFKARWWPWETAGQAAADKAVRKAVAGGKVVAWPPQTGRPVRALIEGLLHPDVEERWGLRQLLAAKDALPDVMFADVAAAHPALAADMATMVGLRHGRVGWGAAAPGAGAPGRPPVSFVRASMAAVTAPMAPALSPPRPSSGEDGGGGDLMRFTDSEGGADQGRAGVAGDRAGTEAAARPAPARPSCVSASASVTEAAGAIATLAAASMGGGGCALQGRPPIPARPSSATTSPAAPPHTHHHTRPSPSTSRPSPSTSRPSPNSASDLGSRHPQPQGWLGGLSGLGGLTGLGLTVTASRFAGRVGSQRSRREHPQEGEVDPDMVRPLIGTSDTDDEGGRVRSRGGRHRRCRTMSSLDMDVEGLGEGGGGERVEPPSHAHHHNKTGADNPGGGAHGRQGRAVPSLPLRLPLRRGGSRQGAASFQAAATTACGPPALAALETAGQLRLNSGDALGPLLGALPRVVSMARLDGGSEGGDGSKHGGGARGRGPTLLRYKRFSLPVHSHRNLHGKEGGDKAGQMGPRRSAMHATITATVAAPQQGAVGTAPPACAATAALGGQGPMDGGRAPTPPHARPGHFKKPSIERLDLDLEGEGGDSPLLAGLGGAAHAPRVRVCAAGRVRDMAAELEAAAAARAVIKAAGGSVSVGADTAQGGACPRAGRQDRTSAAASPKPSDSFASTLQAALCGCFGSSRDPVKHSQYALPMY